jgi:hypothetical protein
LLPIDLKSLARSRRWRTGLDESASVPGQSAEDRAWLVIVPAKYGHLFIHSATELAAHADRTRIASQLVALPGVRVHHRGDREATVVFDPTVLDTVADLLQPRRRKALSDDQRRRLVEAGSGTRFGPRR